MTLKFSVVVKGLTSDQFANRIIECLGTQGFEPPGGLQVEAQNSHQTYIDAKPIALPHPKLGYSRM